ncbi:MAG: hypothetical protein K6E98_10570 [Lachnospiraceae bacterium]|nr:hypothetical protein [Lachnospiraceae bacterium]
MKVVRKILYVITGLLVILTIIIVACAYNPGLTSKIQGFVFRGKTVEITDVNNSEAASEPGDETVVSGAKIQEEPHSKRTIEELGIDPEMMIGNIEDYYNNCRAQIIEHGLGTYSFENVIENESLVQEIYAKYSNKEYVDGYMNSALNEIGATSYEMNLLVEELEGKHYRLTHQIVLNGE